MILAETPLPPAAGFDLMNQVGSMVMDTRILTNSYFTELKAGRFSRAAFTASQRQFYFAVRYFARPMAALMARIPTSSLRQGLIHNLSEEHGFEDDHGHGEGPHEEHGFDPQLAHDLTFLRFLGSLGVSRSEMEKQREFPVVRAFNTALMGTCMMERTEVAFGCLGAIEYAFADICEIIGQEVVKQGWISHEELVHYKLHAQIDKDHAADFFRIVESAWERDGEDRRAVEDGIALGLHVFNSLYEGLYHDACAPS